MFDIAQAGDVWRFSRTPIRAPGPFSDYAGFDRCQVLIKGRGLVLETPNGEIDVRTPFNPVRFAGEIPIVSRLEAGPVEVVNLIGDRSAVSIDMTVFEAAWQVELPAGIHFAYCPAGVARLSCQAEDHLLTEDQALRIESAGRTLLAFASGRILVASIILA